MKMKQPGLLIAAALTVAGVATTVYAASSSTDVDVQARVDEARA